MRCAAHGPLACSFLNENLARSPERVLMPLKGCFGTRSTEKAPQKLVIVPLVVGDSQVLEARSNGTRKQLSKVKVLRVAGHGVAGVLETAQLHLGLQRVRRELVPSPCSKLVHSPSKLLAVSRKVTKAPSSFVKARATVTLPCKKCCRRVHGACCAAMW